MKITTMLCVFSVVRNSYWRLLTVNWRKLDATMRGRRLAVRYQT